MTKHFLKYIFFIALGALAVAVVALYFSSLNRIELPSDIHYKVVLDPASPKTEGEIISVTVYKQDTGEPFPDRWIITTAKNGTITGSDFTDNNGHAITRYAGEGTTIKVTADGSYIPEKTIVLD